MRQWVNTLVLYDSAGRVVRREGYWYGGSLAIAGAMAAWDQDSYAFYADGTESGSSQIGTTNTETSLNVDTNYQCRLLIQEDGGAGGNLMTPEFEYNHNSGGWLDVTTISSVVIAVDSANLTNKGDTTQRLGSGSFISTNGWVSEDGLHPSLVFLTSQECEGLLSFSIVSADVNNGDEILLRMFNMDSYTRNADIAVVKGAAARRVFVVD